MGKPWFHPKRYGYGSGLPCSWEGWAVLVVVLAVIVGTSLLPDRRVNGAASALAVLALIVISALKTRGGWRWRWGRD